MGYNYTVNFTIKDGMLIRYNGSETSVVIPDGVKKIGDETFSVCRSLTTVTIPESVIKIGKEAFRGCNNLPLTVKRGSYAMQYCTENGLNDHRSKNNPVVGCFYF
ncbi:MAG: leucine-rich repeat domain-containing protein [Blautia sp.]|nr:leucine-rich repeat domain-containing protein [Blautia sp.]